MIPKIVDMVGAVDGANLVYTTPGGEAYTPGTFVLILNGRAKIAADDDGWTETTPASGIITTKIAPVGGAFPDRVKGFYLDTTPVPIDSIVFTGGLIGVLPPTIQGQLATAVVQGQVPDASIAGALTGGTISGQLTGTIQGVLKEC